MNSVTAQSMFFGSAPGAELFGWLHRTEADPRIGLVICSPFGREDICAHRSLRRWADAAALAGVPAMRFDYDGCGNSAGDDVDDDRLDAWTRSVHEALDELKRATGVSRLVLMGVRLGAALAVRAALQRDDVVGLVAVAPVVSGRTYLRELTAMARAARAQQGDPTAEALFESAGFVLTQATRASLNDMDLRSLPRSPAPRVLVVERDDLPGGHDLWRAELQRMGAVVDTLRGEGYVGMMNDPHHTVVPVAMIDAVVQWLRQRHDETPVAPASAPFEPVTANSRILPLPREEGAGAVRETAVSIEAGASRLFGVLTTPVDALGSGTAVKSAVLMLNAGSIRHVGPNRMYVPLARRWAARGHAVLRIDISGLGDSPVKDGEPDNAVYSRTALADVESALAFLRERTGVVRCRVFGLCSGAYHAFKAAVAGQGLASAVLINPLTFFWKEGMSLDVEFGEHDVLRIAAAYQRSMRDPRRWLKLLRGQVNMRTLFRVVARRAAGLVRSRLRDAARLLRLSLQDDLHGELRSAVRQGVRLHFVFSFRDPGRPLMRTQAGRIVGRLLKRGQMSIDVIPDADHTFTTHAARERLFAVLDGLMDAELRPAASAPQASQLAGLASDLSAMDPHPVS